MGRDGFVKTVGTKVPKQVLFDGRQRELTLPRTNVITRIVATDAVLSAFIKTPCTARGMMKTTDEKFNKKRRFSIVKVVKLFVTAQGFNLTKINSCDAFGAAYVCRISKKFKSPFDISRTFRVCKSVAGGLSYISVVQS